MKNLDDKKTRYLKREEDLKELLRYYLEKGDTEEAAITVVLLIKNTLIKEETIKNEILRFPKINVSVLARAACHSESFEGSNREIFNAVILALAEKLDPNIDNDLGNKLYFFDEETLSLIWDKISIKRVNRYSLFTVCPGLIEKWFFLKEDAEETLNDIIFSVSQNSTHLKEELENVKKAPDIFFQKLCLLGKLPEVREFAKSILKERGLS